MLRPFFAIFAMVIFAAQVPAQPKAEFVPADEHDPLMAQWKYIYDVHVPPKFDGPYAALNVPTQMFGKAQNNLNDLRLLDAKNKAVPYALRILQGQSQQAVVPIARQFNAVPSPTHRRFELNLELGQIPPSGYNEISILTTGLNYRRKVEVFGDTSDKFSNPRAILGKGNYLVKYDIDHRLIDIHRFHFNAQQFQFLQVFVYADHDEEIPSITQVTVSRSVHVPGEYLTEPASFDYGDKAQPVRSDGEPASAWLINLPGDGMVPCEKLKFATDSPASERPFHMFIANPNLPPTEIFNAQSRWFTENGQQYLEISFPEVFARRLRFVVTDFANEPFSLKSVQATRAVRQLVFAKPEEGQYTQPLKLFTDNPAAGAPNYSQAPKLPPEMKLPPPFAELDGPRQNPAWTAPPLTINERMPWLVYVVLGVACLVLLAILGGLARQAIRRHDQVMASAAPG